MSDLDYWRLCEELTIEQAALLIADVDPASEQARLSPNHWGAAPTIYLAARTAIENALRRKSIRGTLVSRFADDPDRGSYAIANSVDPGASHIDVESLKEWLRSRGLRSGFFFPTDTDAPDYLDPKNSRYAPKLAAAVRAWQAVTDPAGKHPKQALLKWLREHSAEFGLSDEDGKPNDTGIEEVAKVANWQPGGGAPKTPGY